MANIIASPSRYIQGSGELMNLCTYARHFGDNLFIICSRAGQERVEASIRKGMEAGSMALNFVPFQGECCMKEIYRLMDICRELGSTVIVGIGGGKAHDTAKAVAHYLNLPVIIIPTIAATDAPCSSLAVIYTEEGVFEQYLFMPSSPNIVMVDTDVVCKAPVRLLVSGMGDALATYFETRACHRGNAENCVNGKAGLAAVALAKLCYDTLLESGVYAMLAAKEGICTKAVENIIEANTYLSGIGFESGGLAAAHAVHNGLTAIPETHEKYHGEKVAFGTLVQLVLENGCKDEITTVLEFCVSVGLPVTLGDLGVGKADPEQIMEVAKLACATGDTMCNMPFEVQPQDVYTAILGADALGRSYKNK